MRQTPSTSSAAGMMATAAFFAPLISTSPNRGVPPCMIYFVKILTLSSSNSLPVRGVCGRHKRQFARLAALHTRAGRGEVNSSWGRLLRKGGTDGGAPFFPSRWNGGKGCAGAPCILYGGACLRPRQGGGQDIFYTLRYHSTDKEKKQTFPSVFFDNVSTVKRGRFRGRDAKPGRRGRVLQGISGKQRGRPRRAQETDSPVRAAPAVTAPVRPFT